MDVQDLLRMLDFKGGNSEASVPHAQKSWCVGFELPVLAPTLSSVGSVVHSGMWAIRPCGLQICRFG
jgi:hypothetical protein